MAHEMSGWCVDGRHRGGLLEGSLWVVLRPDRSRSATKGAVFLGVLCERGGGKVFRCIYVSMYVEVYKHIYVYRYDTERGKPVLTLRAFQL